MKRKQFYRTFLIATLIFVTSNFAFSSSISPSLVLQYFKNSDNQRYLKATLTYTENRKDKPLADKEIIFFVGEKKNELARVNTSEKGVAILQFANDYKIPIGKDDLWHFSSEFTGIDSIEAASSDELAIKDLQLDLQLDLIDSVKTVLLQAHTVNDKGKSVPLADEAINVYVARRFSLLQVGDGTFDADGKLSVEFPNDIPGDKDGNITVVAKLDEHPTYGNVEKRANIQWGLPSTYKAATTHRALWTKGAPTWMIVALTIMLSGVWGHYLYAIICLIRIKLLSKKEEEK